MHTIASPDYVARFGCPRHPSELVQHECLGYTMGGATGSWTYRVEAGWVNFPVQSRITASNGDALTEAAAQGLGITIQPDFVAQPFLDEGRVQNILEDFDMPELGIYAMLPGNRQVPHRVRVLMDFIVARVGTTPTGVKA